MNELQKEVRSALCFSNNNGRKKVVPTKLYNRNSDAKTRYLSTCWGLSNLFLQQNVQLHSQSRSGKDTIHKGLSLLNITIGSKSLIRLVWNSMTYFFEQNFYCYVVNCRLTIETIMLAHCSSHSVFSSRRKFEKLCPYNAELERLEVEVLFIYLYLLLKYFVN